jgi:hypothetical protein
VKFGAINPYNLLRTEALQQSPSRPTAAPVGNANEFQLPRLKNGPDADVFVKRSAPNVESMERVAGSRAENVPNTHFSGGKIVPAVRNERALLTPDKPPSLNEKLFGSLPSNMTNQFSEAKLNMAKKPVQSGLSSTLLSFGSLGALASVVAGPALLVANPGVINPAVASLSTRLP